LKNKFIDLMTEILEEDELVKLEDKLDGFDSWDSLGVLSLLSMIDEEYELTIGNKDVESFKTVEDLWNFIQKNAELE
jgi:acyl carrier protein